MKKDKYVHIMVSKTEWTVCLADSRSSLTTVVELFCYYYGCDDSLGNDKLVEQLYENYTWVS